MQICSQSPLWARVLLAGLAAFQLSSCAGQAARQAATEHAEDAGSDRTRAAVVGTMFPQIHAHLGGRVSQFVRVLHQDSRGNYWFGTNGDGIIRYDGRALEKMAAELLPKRVAVRAIVEDKAGNLWFGTSSGLVRYNGTAFAIFSTEAGLQHEEIWSLAVDSKGLVWVGSIGGVSHFDGTAFTTFPLPEARVAQPQPMLSERAILDILEDREGTIWLVADGNGIFKYSSGEFYHLTAANGLTDNNVADVFEDRTGHIWIGTFNGGVSRIDGDTFTNFTRDGIVEGEETYNFIEDRRGNVWFSAEGHGAYRYDGTGFVQFTTDNGLTANVVQSLLEDRKGQIWFGTWQGMSIYDGDTIADAGDREPWTK